MARFQPFFAALRISSFYQPAVMVLSLVLVASSAQLSKAEQGLENFLPATTKGFVSFPDIDRAIRRWDETQLGQMMADPAMKPFVEEIQDMFQGDFLELGKRLGVRVGQLQELRGGEVCLAFVQPEGATTEHAAILLMDVRGREQQAAELLDSVVTNLEGASRTTINSARGVRMMVTSLPPSQDSGRTSTQKSYSVIHEGRLFITDRADVAEQVLGLMAGRPGSLNEVAAFRSVMSKWDNENSDVRWFIEPFGLIEVLRASRVTPEQASIDLVEVLGNQGFRAIEGVGGHIQLSTSKHEILHRTMIYAPGKAEGSRFDLAARMLSFPNSRDMAPMPWVPANITTHMTMRWDLRNAFEHSKSLVNEVAGEKVFDEILENIRTDENGPQINIREELVAHFADRITVLADHETPITEDSERLAVAIELKNEQIVRAAIDRAMANDPKAHAHAVGHYRIWEMGGAEEEDEEIIVMIDDPFASNPFGPSLTPDGNEEECKDDEEATDDLLSNVCIAVAHGQLFVSKKFGLLQRLLAHDPKAGKLNEADDFGSVREALQQLGSNADCLRFFVRTDLAYEPAYELLRSGRLPEANSLFGKVLNRFAQPKNPDRPRTQKIDGATMPPFDQVRRYLGPAGMFVVSTKEGWIITGCLLQNRTGA